VLFSFVGGDSICSRTALDYVPGEWVRKLCLVSVAYLFILQVYASRFGTGQQGEMTFRRKGLLLFSVL
jgi:hypothetical protein